MAEKYIITKVKNEANLYKVTLEITSGKIHSILHSLECCKNNSPVVEDVLLGLERALRTANITF